MNTEISESTSEGVLFVSLADLTARLSRLILAAYRSVVPAMKVAFRLHASTVFLEFLVQLWLKLVSVIMVHIIRYLPPPSTSPIHLLKFLVFYVRFIGTPQSVLILAI